jgi:hypothetical protein
VNNRTVKKLRKQAKQITPGEHPLATKAWLRALKRAKKRGQRVVWLEE